MLNNLSLSKKMNLIFGVILAVSIISAAVTVFANLQVKASVDETKNLGALYEDITSILSNINESRTYVQEFILSGDVSLRNTYLEKSQEFSEYENILNHKSISLLPTDSQKLLEELISLFTTWNSDIVSKQMEYAKDPYTFDMARLMENSAQNNEIWKKIDENLGNITSAVEKLTANATEEQISSLNTMMFVSIISILISITVIIFANLLIKKVVVLPITKISEQFKKLGDYDLTLNPIEIESKDEIGELTETFNHLLTRLKDIINSVRAVSSQMAAASEEMSSTMNGITGTMSSQAEASSQISIAIRDSSEQSHEINTLASSSRENIHSMNTRTEEAVNNMVSLTDNSKRIADVLGVINDIADQVNLLALNAAIEAARAGDAGRGFAVVAEEVKKLAENVTKSTEDVQKEIIGLEGHVTETSRSLKGISSSLDIVAGESEQVTDAISQQSSAIEEISATVENFSSQVEQLNNSIREIDEVSQSIAKEAGVLDERVNEFKMN